MPLPRLLFCLSMLLAAPAIPAAFGQTQPPSTVEIFSDDFANGVVADSDGFAGFWTLSTPANSSMSEAGGKITVTAGGPSSPHGTIAAYLFSGTPSPKFNFFRQPLHFSASVSVVGSASANQSLFRFTLAGSSGSGYNADDALTLVIRGDNLFSLSVKQDRPATPTESVRKLLESTAAGAITGFDLTLDGANYSLLIHHQGGNGGTSFTGAHGALRAQWGVDGDSAFQLETTRSTGAAAGAGLATVATIDRISIDKTASAALFEDAFDNGNPLDSETETAAWTPSTPDTSSVTEPAGKLIQTATSPTANTILAASRTAVSPKYNFFDRQLRVSASVKINGTAAQGYMKQGRVLLASAGTNGLVAPDTISVGLRGYNDLSLFTKINGPVVHPDNTANPAVKALLGTPDEFNLVTFSGEEIVDGLDLTLNSSRYRLVSRNGGAGSGLARFTGLHGIERAQWGNGDSCLMLEAIRTGGAAANTSASAAWDNLAVTTDTSTILDERWWDFQTTYPGTGSTNITGKFRLWLPATETVIRGVILIGPGSGGDYRHLVHDPVAQEAARAIGFGLLGYTNAANMNFWTQNPTSIRTAVQAVLNQAAAVSGRAELRNAPLCITGNSAGAFDSTFLARYWPERTIAFVAHRGGSYGTGGALSAASKKIPGLFMAGSLDSNPSTNPAALKTIFDQWRTAGAQVAYAVNWGVGHTMRGNQSWEATWPWIVEVVNLRYPRPLLPPTEPGTIPTLLAREDSAGWLGDNASFSSSTTPSVTHAFTYVAPAASYTGNASKASWIPNETCARMYRALTSTDLAARSVVPLHGPLRIATPAQFMDPLKQGSTVTIEIDPREFDNSSPLASVEFFAGDTLIATDSAGPEWKCDFAPASTGLHTITVVATDSAGARRDALRTLYVVPANHAPLAFPQNRATAANTPLAGTIAYSDPEGGSVSFAISTQPRHGTLSVDSRTGAFLYRPAHAFAGPDLFGFSVDDGDSVSTAEICVEVAPAADADGDGLPDAWKSLHGVGSPTHDEDGDGFDNLREYLADTDPRDAGDAPKIISLAKSDGSPAPFVLRWAAKGGVRYRVQFSENLSAFVDVVRPATSEIQPGASGADGIAEFVDDYSLTPVPAAPRRFYRVVVVNR